MLRLIFPLLLTISSILYASEENIENFVKNLAQLPIETPLTQGMKDEISKLKNKTESLKLYLSSIGIFDVPRSDVIEAFGPKSEGVDESLSVKFLMARKLEKLSQNALDILFTYKISNTMLSSLTKSCVYFGCKNVFEKCINYCDAIDQFVENFNSNENNQLDWDFSKDSGPVTIFLKEQGIDLEKKDKFGFTLNDYNIRFSWWDTGKSTNEIKEVFVKFVLHEGWNKIAEILNQTNFKKLFDIEKLLFYSKDIQSKIIDLINQDVINPMEEDRYGCNLLHRILELNFTWNDLILFLVSHNKYEELIDKKMATELNEQKFELTTLQWALVNAGLDSSRFLIKQLLHSQRNELIKKSIDQLSDVELTELQGKSLKQVALKNLAQLEKEDQIITVEVVKKKNDVILFEESLNQENQKNDKLQQDKISKANQVESDTTVILPLVNEPILVNNNNDKVWREDLTQNNQSKVVSSFVIGTSILSGLVLLYTFGPILYKSCKNFMNGRKTTTT